MKGISIVRVACLFLAVAASAFPVHAGPMFVERPPVTPVTGERWAGALSGFLDAPAPSMAALAPMLREMRTLDLSSPRSLEALRPVSAVLARSLPALLSAPSSDPQEALSRAARLQVLALPVMGPVLGTHAAAVERAAATSRAKLAAVQRDRLDAGMRRVAESLAGDFPSPDDAVAASPAGGSRLPPEWRLRKAASRPQPEAEAPADLPVIKGKHDRGLDSYDRFFDAHAPTPEEESELMVPPGAVQPGDRVLGPVEDGLLAGTGWIKVVRTGRSQTKTTLQALPEGLGPLARLSPKSILAHLAGHPRRSPRPGAADFVDIGPGQGVALAEAAALHPELVALGIDRHAPEYSKIPEARRRPASAERDSFEWLRPGAQLLHGSFFEEIRGLHGVRYMTANQSNGAYSRDLRDNFAKMIDALEIGGVLDVSVILGAGKELYTAFSEEKILPGETYDQAVLRHAQTAVRWLNGISGVAVGAHLNRYSGRKSKGEDSLVIRIVRTGGLNIVPPLRLVSYRAAEAMPYRVYSLDEDLQSKFGPDAPWKRPLIPGEPAYLQPNEPHPERARPILDEAPAGAYVSVGTERGFIGAALAPRVTHLVLADASPDVVEYNRINIALLRLAHDREEYRRLRRADHREIALLAAERPLPADLRALLADRSAWGRWRDGQFANRVNAARPSRTSFIDSNYLHDDALFLRLKAMADGGRMAAVRVNLGKAEGAERLRAGMAAAGVPLSVLDISNAWWPSYIPRPALVPLLAAAGTVASPRALLVLTNQFLSGWSYHGFVLSEVVAHPKKWVAGLSAIRAFRPADRLGRVTRL